MDMSNQSNFHCKKFPKIALPEWFTKEQKLICLEDAKKDHCDKIEILIKKIKDGK